MKVLVTGAMGQLGWDVCRRLTALQIEHKGVGSADFDLTDEKAVMAAVKAYGPDAVIHCAAYTAVDRAEEEREKCRAVNEGGTKNVALACKAVGAKMVYLSTDYVFNGNGEQCWRPEDKRAPCNYYGLTKALGEDAVTGTLERYFIVRVTWVFGAHGNNIIKTVLRLGQERERLAFVTDQIASPTYTVDLAVLLCEMIQTERYGIYHATNEGVCSSYELACAVLEEAGIKTCHIDPILTANYPTRAVRPLNSRLSKDRLTAEGFEKLPEWRDALRRYLRELSET